MSHKPGMDTWSEEIPVDESYQNEGSSEQDSDWDQQSSRSLASTVNTYTFENGRRYHAFHGSYWAPSDTQTELFERVLYGIHSALLRRQYLNLPSHHLFNLTLGDCLFLAPAQRERLRRVIDVGTGTGLWALDFADQYEHVEVLATDITPPPPELESEFNSRPNATFDIDDCCKEWTDTNLFDFIHVRCLYGSVADWPKFYKECFDHTAPGGYIEQLEMSMIPYSDDGGVDDPGCIWNGWANLAADAGRASGQTFYAFDKMKRLVEDAGYVDVEERTFKWPIGQWARTPKMKEKGRFFKMVWQFGMEAWALRPATNDLNWPKERVDDFLAETRQALGGRRDHIYYHMHVVYGRRPDA